MDLFATTVLAAKAILVVMFAVALAAHLVSLERLRRTLDQLGVPARASIHTLVVGTDAAILILLVAAPAWGAAVASIYLLAVTVSLFGAWRRGIRPDDCGCGLRAKPVGPRLFMRNLALVGAAAWIAQADGLGALGVALALGIGIGLGLIRLDPRAPAHSHVAGYARAPLGRGPNLAEVVRLRSQLAQIDARHITLDWDSAEVFAMEIQTEDLRVASLSVQVPVRNHEEPQSEPGLLVQHSGSAHAFPGMIGRLGLETRPQLVPAAGKGSACSTWFNVSEGSFAAQVAWCCPRECAPRFAIVRDRRIPLVRRPDWWKGLLAAPAAESTLARGATPAHPGSGRELPMVPVPSA